MAPHDFYAVEPAPVVCHWFGARRTAVACRWCRPGGRLERMVAAANLVEVAALVGDTARATILAALMGGQALTGSELAFLARISRPTASEHLVKLVEARLIAVTRQGRYRYYRIASPLVARMIESIIAVAAIEVPSRYQPRSIRDEALRFARTCYDHVAGQVGVAIADALVANGHIVLGEDGGEVTEAGARFLTGFGADLRPRGKRIFCLPCLDWSERRYHVAGLVGAEIWRCCLERGWLTRERDSRALRLTAAGKAGLLDAFGVDLADEPHSKKAVVSAATRHPDRLAKVPRRLFFPPALSHSDFDPIKERANDQSPFNGCRGGSDEGRKPYDRLAPHLHARLGAVHPARGRPGRAGERSERPARRLYARAGHSPEPGRRRHGAGLSVAAGDDRDAAVAGRVQRSPGAHGRRPAQPRLGATGHHRQPARRRRQCRRGLCRARAGRRLHADGRYRCDADVQCLPLQEHAVRSGEGLRTDHQWRRQHHLPRGQFAGAGRARCRS